MKFSVHFNAAGIFHSRAICFGAFSQIALRMTWHTVALTGSTALETHDFWVMLLKNSYFSKVKVDFYETHVVLCG